MYTLLIVEDQPLIRAGLKKYFQWEALGVTTILEAENGEIGMNLAIRNKPELIITDISMPRKNGLDMIEQLRNRLPYTQYIILTGFDKFDYAQRAIRTGVVQDFLLKPLQYDDGLKSIQHCIKLIDEIENKHKDANHELLKANEIVHHILKQGTRLSATKKEIHLFEKIGTFLLQHIEERLTLNMVAEHFYYNASYLSRLFKEKLGRNYSVFVAEVKINYAKTLLLDAEHSITKVGELCGYKSYKHFVKVFKEICQQTPTDYRHQIMV